jgi:hypothetical protein
MPESLPKTEPLPGVVCVQWKRCGRPNCRCARGQLHGPYHCRFWREGGKLKKAYVRRADVAQVHARCQARRLARAAVARGWDEWRALAAQVREVEAQ